MDKKAVSPVIAIVLLLMMTVAAAGAAYFWLTQMQSSVQEQSTKSIENIVQKSGRKLMAQGAICEPTAPDGMVAWWEFYEGEDNKTHDSSENENTGTLHPGSSGEITTDSQMWVEGRAGKALEFDGSDDYVEVPDDPSLSGEEGLTFNFWLKPLTIPFPNIGVIAGKYDDNNGYCILGGSDSNKLYLFLAEGGTRYTIGYAQMVENEWAHITGVFTGSEGILYKDGKEVGRSSADVGVINEDLRIAISPSNWWGGTYFNIKADEVRIYNRALSGAEINETYKGKMKVRVTVRNIGSVSIPEAEFVANLKKDGTTVDSDTYTTTSSIDTGDLKTLTFYFNEMRPGGEYNINIPGIDVSQSVKCHRS